MTDQPTQYASSVAAIMAGTTSPPPLSRRFGALLVDWIMCVAISAFFGDPRRGSWVPPTVLIIEYAFFLGLFGQTPGMAITKIRCVSAEHGGPIGVFRAALRGALLALVIPGLIMDAARRGLHDKAAGSIIVPS